MVAKKALIFTEDKNLEKCLKKALQVSFELSMENSFDNFLKKAGEPNIGLLIFHCIEADTNALQRLSAQKGGDPTKLPAMVVISPHSTDEFIKNSYRAGAIDFYSEPVNISVFQQNMERLFTHLKTIKKVTEQHESALSVTSTALGQASFYGTGLEIIASLNQVDSEQAIAKQVLSSLSQAGVHCSIQFREDNQTHEFDERNESCNENIIKAFSVLKDQGRIYRFGKRLMLNDETVSILVKYVKNDSQTLHDGILDVGAKLVPAINLRYKSILQNRALVKTQVSLDACLKGLQDGITNIHENNIRLLNSVTSQVQLSFHQLELNETQEQFFLSLLENEIAKFNNDNEFTDLNDLLKHSLSQLSQTIQSQQSQEEPADDYQDLEFF